MLIKETLVIEFSEKIKYIRKYHNLTQDQLAKKLNVSRKTISAWENNRGIPDYHLVKTIEKIFVISENQLMDNNKQLFLNSNESRNEFYRKIKWPLLIEIIFIFFGYLTLLRIYNNFINTVILISFSIYLNIKNKQYYSKTLSIAYYKKLKLVSLLLFLLHFLLGFHSFITVLVNDNSSRLALGGVVLAWILLSYIIMNAIIITFQTVSLIKTGNPWLSISEIRKIFKLRPKNKSD